MASPGVFHEFLQRGRRFVVTGHENPDGDCLGSQVALYHFLRERGVEATLLACDPLPGKFHFLVEDVPVVAGGEEPLRAAVARADAAFACDCASIERLGLVGRVVEESGLPTLFLDHHAVDSGRRPRWLLCRTGAAATGQIVFDLVRESGATLTPRLAEGIFVALVTDTGWFRYSNTGPAVLRMAAELVDAGAQPTKVYGHLFQSNAVAWLKLIGSVLGRVETACGGRAIWSVITRSMLEDSGARLQETEEILDLLRSHEGVDVAALFKETTGGDEVRVSLRSKAIVDVAEIARRHGGGGHARAAGVSLAGGVPRARKVILGEIDRQLAGNGRIA